MSRTNKISRKNVGVALDGRSILFVRAKIGRIEEPVIGQSTLEGSIIPDPPVTITGPTELNRNSVEQLLLFLRQLTRKVLSAETLSFDFGHKSEISRSAVYLFYDALSKSKKPKVSVLFKEWDRIFGVVYGEAIEKSAKEAKQLSDYYGLPYSSPDLKILLFSIHTYFALLMKMIAAEVLAMQHQGLLASFANNWSVLADQDLEIEFKDLESGGFFKKFGISNFLEGTFYSWYIEEWNSEIASVIREIAKKLSKYEPATARVEPNHIKDLLKGLYHYLIPKSIRHDLGEYYTPDWLAELLIEHLGYEGLPDIRILDPSCGSGTFLVLLIRRIIQNVEDRPELYEQVLERVLQNVVGFDINPISIMASRTNYLISISPLRRLSYKEIEIPIYLSDSILIPHSVKGQDKNDDCYNAKTTVGDFAIPISWANIQIVKILDELDSVISQRGSFSVLHTRLRNILGSNIDKTKPYLLSLFDAIEKLQRENRDHIWARILKNNFAPLYLGKFDYIVGNPPWVNWQNLSLDYRNATADLWWNYGLLQKAGGKEASFGGIKSEFSMLFTYCCIDKYLKREGKIGFVITQSGYRKKWR